ncbi:hypothetical protein QJS10_CPA09g01394 [Acorus calamus]|uniref:DUF4283 domain-containing protein n=1 Tax=Acorus calamus TaxID=4465 RepID=A0AAV9E4L1_ACOCL|nr:hypothetical protein QJS10_CPA09g01394 [Acorus calamus]
MELEQLTSIPIWVKFPNLPLHMWSIECLSKIANAIGVPLYRDAATRQGTRISFARVCIEIEAGTPLPDTVIVNSNLGGLQEFKVLYDWKPQACSHCATFGHDDAMCCNKPSKAQSTAPAPNGEKTHSTPTAIWQEVRPKNSRHEASVVVPLASHNDKSSNQFAVLETEDTMEGTRNMGQTQENEDDTLNSPFEESVVAAQTSLAPSKHNSETKNKISMVYYWQGAGPNIAPTNASHEGTDKQDLYVLLTPPAASKPLSNKEQNRVPFVALLENKISSSEVDLVRKRILGRRIAEFSHLHDGHGQIWILWLKDILKVELLSSSEQFMHCAMTIISTGQLIHYTVMYGSNSLTERQYYGRAFNI